MSIKTQKLLSIQILNSNCTGCKRHAKKCLLVFSQKILTDLKINFGMFELHKFLLRKALPEVESRTQGSRPMPRPRMQKNPRPRPRTALPRTDSLEKGQECSRPRPRTKSTAASALQKEFFSGQKKCSKKILPVLELRSSRRVDSRGGRGVLIPPKICIVGVQRVKDPPIKMNVFAISHEY